MYPEVALRSGSHLRECVFAAQVRSDRHCGDSGELGRFHGCFVFGCISTQPGPWSVGRQGCRCTPEGAADCATTSCTATLYLAQHALEDSHVNTCDK
eukprot:3025907-Amphidinium_carterae.1